VTVVTKQDFTSGPRAVAHAYLWAACHYVHGMGRC
jgi:hypothetical protein